MAEILYYVGMKKVDLEFITLSSPFKPSSFLPAFLATFGDIPSVWPKFLSPCAMLNCQSYQTYIILWCGCTKRLHVQQLPLSGEHFLAFFFFLHALGRVLYSSLVKAEFCRYHLALNFSTKIAFQQKFFEVLGAFLVLFSLFSTVVCSHSELWQLSKFNLSPEYLGIAAPHFFHLWKTAVFKSMFCFGTYCWKKHCNFWLRTPLYFTALSTFHKGLAI